MRGCASMCLVENFKFVLTSTTQTTFLKVSCQRQCWRLWQKQSDQVSWWLELCSGEGTDSWWRNENCCSCFDIKSERISWIITMHKIQEHYYSSGMVSIIYPPLHTYKQQSTHWMRVHCVWWTWNMHGHILCSMWMDGWMDRQNIV